MRPHQPAASQETVERFAAARRECDPSGARPVFRSEGPPDVVAQLESLDDLIFAAIDGDPCALQASGPAWHKALVELGADAVEETRRQYLRHAQSVWERLRRQPAQPPHKIFAAIEIIGMLVNSDCPPSDGHSALMRR